MTWYLAAYAMFWAVLFGYLMGVSGRQQRLVERAEDLTRRLAERGPGSERGSPPEERS
ncbi:MAG TPA: hypothetical protein VJ788_08800 [Gemmatimonadota bacterium]|nr:hypothetical protein [Gemmatimonadota bacterium]